MSSIKSQPQLLLPDLDWLNMEPKNSSSISHKQRKAYSSYFFLNLLPGINLANNDHGSLQWLFANIIATSL